MGALALFLGDCSATPMKGTAPGELKASGVPSFQLHLHPTLELPSTPKKAKESQR
jgi:hypothetical protein